jgi:hypothetical protein
MNNVDKKLQGEQKASRENIKEMFERSDEELN